MKKILSLLISLAMVMSSAVVSYAEDAIAKETVAKIGEIGYETLDEAVKNAEEGSTILLIADIDYAGTAALEINKAVTLDLGGKTLTTHGTYGGLRLKGNCSLKNGTLVHQGTVTAIKAWNIEAIEDIVIDVAYREGKTIGGIVIQEGNNNRIGTIKNVTIKGEGLTNGIETYNCGNATEDVIGSMENVTIDAKKTGMLISAPCGTATNCDIKGGETGVELWIKGTYSATLNLVDCDVEGGKMALYVHDEFTGDSTAVNSGKIELTTDDKSTFVSENGKPLEYVVDRAENVVLSEEIEALKTIRGFGTEEEPYLIGNLEELKWFRNDVNAGNNYSKKFVKLTADIDLANEEWIPIGYMGKNFVGTFDGDNKTIRNLYINKELTNKAENNGIGFFGRTDSPAVIQNLTIENADVSGSLYVAAIVGLGYTGNKVENCTVKGKIFIDAWWYAGVIGGNGYMSLVNNCHVIGGEGTNSYINGNNGSYIGGIWGFRGEGNNKTTNCTVTNISISGVDRVGGISGIGHYGNAVEGCAVTSTSIQATDQDASTVGLIVGACQGTETSPTVFKANKVTETVAKVGDVEISDMYGTNINGSTAVTNYVAQIDGVLYEDFQDALKALKEDSTLTLLNDVTIDYAWDARKTGATITVPVTINGNGKTIKFTNTVFDGYNYLAAFRIESNAKIENLTIDMSEAKSGWGTRIRAISFKGTTLYVSDCNFIGNPELTSSRAIIYGEGAERVNNVQVTITHSTFKDWKRGVTDNENGDDVWSVNINGSEFENADVSISALSQIKFRGNTMIDSYANLTSYTKESKLEVIATGNTLSENTALEMNTIANAATVETQDGFLLPVAEIGSKEYFNLETALASANAGETVKLIDDITLTAPVTVTAETNAVLDLNGFTVSYESDVLGEYMIVNNGILTVDDLSETKEGKIIYAYTGEGDSTYSKGNWTIDNRNELTVNNGTIENATPRVPLASYAINNNSAAATSARLTVNGGKILNKNNVAVRQFVGGKNEVIVNDGDIEGTRAIWLQLAGSDGTKAPEVTLDINGGILTANGGEEGYLLAIYSYTYGASRNNVNIDISGGTFNGDVALGGGNKTTYENASITGGRFEGDVYTYHTEAPGFIAGGNFATDVTEYCSNGFRAEQNDDGRYEIKEIPSNIPVVTVGNDSITVSAYIKNTTDKATPVRLLVATYDEQGKLVSVGSETTDSIAAGVQMTEETMTAVSKNSADTYRVFIWTEEMLPLINTTRVTVE